MLFECPDLSTARLRVFKLWTEVLKTNPIIFPVVKQYTLDSDVLTNVQFVLDCSVLPNVIALVQKFGQNILDQLFYLTRSLCFSLHKARLKIL